MSTLNIPSNEDELRIAKERLKEFITNICRILKRFVLKNEIEIDEIFLETEKELNEILIKAFKDLNIDEDEDFTRLDLIKILIDDLDATSLNSVGLIGDSLRMKLFVYETIRDRFFDLITKGKKGIMRLFRKLVNVIDSILGSLKEIIKLLSVIDPITEFKDIYSNTRKAVE